MANFLKIMLWNANGLLKHQRELEVILDNEKIDVCLIAETHFTKHSFVKFKNFVTYHTIHPNNTARGGSAVIVRKNLKHSEEEKLQTEEFQATTIQLFTASKSLIITSLYSPPRHKIKYEQYLRLIELHHDSRFIIGGDFNAKHTHWGSRVTTTKGKEMFRAAKDKGCEIVSTGSPTYWPTDTNKQPDLIDFFIVNKIPTSLIKMESGFDMNSDHSPVFFTLFENIPAKDPLPYLTNKYTDWEYFQSLLYNSNIDNTEPTTTDEIDSGVECLTNLIQSAAWNSTPIPNNSTQVNRYPPHIREKINLKRKLRKKWQHTRYPADRTRLNKMTKELSMEIKHFRNGVFHNHLKKLTNDRTTDYSLWKLTKTFKRPTIQNSPIRMDDSSWAKTNDQKVEIFSNYLQSIFSEDTTNIGINDIVGEPDISIPEATTDEVMDEINKNMKLKKCPGFDLITTEVLRRLTFNCVARITQLFNACLKLRYVPLVWKIAEVLMIQKPGKPATEVTSYRPISLLPVLSKLFEKIFLRRLKPIIERNNLIPTHQFGFRNSHSTIDQVHRITNVIEQSLEERKICSAVLLDVSQAFDKVWHNGLLRKIRGVLPKPYVEVIKSYLEDRYFRVKLEDAYSRIKEINTGVPQGSILGPILYLLYTYDVPTPSNSIIATFADDTAILAVADTENIANAYLQHAVNQVSKWTKDWRIKLNHTKSIHINFTNKCTLNTPVYIDEFQIPFSNNAKYLGMTLDAKLRWKEHVKKKCEELNIKWAKLKWLIGRKSALSIENKILIYNQQLKPIWLYGIQLWGCTRKKNVTSIQTFQNKVLRSIVNAPWYIRNKDIHRDLGIKLVAEEIKNVAKKHDARLRAHVNPEAVNLNNPTGPPRRLKRVKPYDLVGT